MRVLNRIALTSELQAPPPLSTHFLLRLSSRVLVSSSPRAFSLEIGRSRKALLNY